MQAMARSSHAAWVSFFTVRRVTSVAARRSTALVFTRTWSTQSRFSGMRRLASRVRPFRTTGIGCTECAPLLAAGAFDGIGWRAMVPSPWVNSAFKPVKKLLRRAEKSHIETIGE
jgi:hypothetical protein